MDEPSPHSVVSHYRVLRQLGAGGMGEVYLADDLTLERKVAIKFLSPSASLDTRAHKRLLREAQAVAALDHPGICAVHEIGTHTDGRRFIVMQYAEGESLAAVLERGRLAPLEALSYCAQIAQALSAAHRHGIVHRDLKPHNVVVAPDGHVKLLDFGIATSIATGDGHGEPAATRTQLTEAHALLGTAPYMSPEQIEHRAIDARSDLFSLGAVLYECLTGRRAFEGRSTLDTCMQVVTVEPPPPSSVVAGLTPQHDALCGRLLAKAPEARFQTAQEFLGAVSVIAPGMGTGTYALPPAPAMPQTRWLARTGTALALVALAAAGAFAWRWQVTDRLPAAPAAAQRWFDRGVASLRNGAFASGRAALEEAVKVFPAYVQAHARLADACAELDDERGAQAALLRVAALVPDASRLARDDRLRIEALRASVLREHDQALAAYRAIVDLDPADASRWLDLGRASEAAWRLGEARAHYERALALDAQYAPAHLRLGVLASQAGEHARALAAFDEAARLYQLDADAEGEAQALLDRGIALNGAGDLAAARAALERVRNIATAQRLPVQRLRATFELASVTSSDGRFDDAARMAEDAVNEAIAAGYQGLAANGLVDLGEALSLGNRDEDAESHVQRAIALADQRAATRTAMRARLVLASMRTQQGRHDEAIEIAAAPLAFFTRTHFPSYIADATLILARAHEGLEHYEQAEALSRDVLALAESFGHDSMAAEALENLAGQQTTLGELSAALDLRTRIEAIHRRQEDHSTLPFDLANRAELLIRLGRGADGETLLAEIDQRIAEGHTAYTGRRRRVAMLRALRAVTEHRLRDAVTLAAQAAPSAPSAGDNTTVLAGVLAAYARAHLPAAGFDQREATAWLERASGPGTRREASYWVAAAVLARGHADSARAIVARTLDEPLVRRNAELSWRLASVAREAQRQLPALARDGAMRQLATESHGRLETMFQAESVRYFARRDFTMFMQDEGRTSHD